MELLPFKIAVPFFLLLVGLEVWYESREKEKTYRLNNALANMSAGALELVIGSSTHIILLIIYMLIYENFRLFTLENTWWTLLLVFILYEFCYYWQHRMGHEVNFLWSGHIVHHQSEDMNFTAALRLSSTSPFLGTPFYFPIALLGFSPLYFVIVKIIGNAYQFFLHTEHIRTLPAWYGWIFNTPAHHRVHHGRNQKYLDKNYGSVLIIWDRLFNTFQEEEERPDYGVTVSLNTWNPWIINVEHFVRLFHWLKQCRTPGDAFCVLFGKPGKLPFYLKKPAKKRQKAEKYDAGPDRRFSSGYILAQFFASLFVTLILLFYYEAFPLWLIIIYSIWAIWFISMVGVLLESERRDIVSLEIIKLFSFPTMMFFLFWGNYLASPVIPLLVLGFTAGCFSSLLRAAKQ